MFAESAARVVRAAASTWLRRDWMRATCLRIAASSPAKSATSALASSAAFADAAGAGWDLGALDAAGAGESGAGAGWAGAGRMKEAMTAMGRRIIINISAGARGGEQEQEEQFPDEAHESAAFAGVTGGLFFRAFGKAGFGSGGAGLGGDGVHWV